MAIFRITYSVKRIGRDLCAQFDVNTMDEAIEELHKLYAHTKEAKIVKKTEDHAQLEVSINDYEFSYFINKKS